MSSYTKQAYQTSVGGGSRSRGIVVEPEVVLGMMGNDVEGKGGVRKLNVDKGRWRNL